MQKIKPVKKLSEKASVLSFLASRPSIFFTWILLLVVLVQRK